MLTQSSAGKRNGHEATMPVCDTAVFSGERGSTVNPLETWPTDTPTHTRKIVFGSLCNTRDLQICLESATYKDNIYTKQRQWSIWSPSGSKQPVSGFRQSRWWRGFKIRGASALESELFLKDSSLKVIWALNTIGCCHLTPSTKH